GVCVPGMEAGRAPQPTTTGRSGTQRRLTRPAPHGRGRANTFKERSDETSARRSIAMSRITSNVQSLIAQRSLTQNNQALGTSLERLSTGLRINRGKDDPAGLLASQRLDS